MKRAFTILALVTFLGLTGTRAFASLPAYMSIVSQQQGIIQGGVTIKGREGSIEVIQLQHEIISPRDPATGQASGRRQHKPFVIRKELDKSSPLLFKALVTGDPLSSVELKFFLTDPKGLEKLYYTIKLTNAHISSIQTALPDARNPALSQYKVYEEIAFTYQKIEWTWVDGGVSASDDWESPAA